MNRVRQSMFIPCKECNEFITHDLTDDTPSTEYGFIPRTIFEGDEYIATLYRFFDTERWECFPCSEVTFDAFIEDSENPIYACDFVNGFGRLDCKGCEKCSKWDWRYFQREKQEVN